MQTNEQFGLIPMLELVCSLFRRKPDYP